MKIETLLSFVFLFSLCSECFIIDNLPLVLTTWPYQNAVNAGWKTITTINKTSVDAIEATGNTCELEQCRHSVGFGGSPDEDGETTLDAMIMDGNSHNVGGVGGLRRVKSAIKVARYVLDNTDHSLLVGDQATQFAISMGFKEENLTTNYSKSVWETWKAGNCQPNFRENVSPDPRTSCGPYTPNPNHVSNSHRRRAAGRKDIGVDNHDTIGIIAIDSRGNIAAGTSTNGLTYKIPGRVGDSPIAGAGAYADSDIGAAACTGNGDIMMRFLPSYQAVTLMGNGMTPTQAATTAINAIRRKYPNFKGAVVAANKQGQYGAACHLWTNYAITFRSPTVPTATVYNVSCH